MANGCSVSSVLEDPSNAQARNESLCRARSRCLSARLELEQRWVMNDVVVTGCWSASIYGLKLGMQVSLTALKKEGLPF